MLMNLDGKLVKDKLAGFLRISKLKSMIATLMKQNLELQSISCNC